MPQFLNSIPVLRNSYPGKLSSRNSTDSNDLLYPFIPWHGPLRKQSYSTLACIRLHRNIFTQLFHSNGCTHNIQYRVNLSVVACGRYLAAVVSLSPQFVLWASTPLTYGAEPFLRSHQLCSHSRTSQYFMEPEGSLPCSKEPSTGPYPEPDRSSPYHPILSMIYLNTLHPPTSWSS
jgi:hypothetical protein